MVDVSVRQCLKFCLVLIMYKWKPVVSKPAISGRNQPDDNIASKVQENSGATTTSTTKYYPPFEIITRPPLPCCQAGYKAGSWGYLCVANPRFVSQRYYLPHPFKMKFTPRRQYVQLDLAHMIERCSKNPAKGTIYEKCCEKAQHRLYQRIGLEP